MINIGHD